VKAKSQVFSKRKTKQTQPKTKPKHLKKTPGELGETQRFQKKILEKHNVPPLLLDHTLSERRKTGE